MGCQTRQIDCMCLNEWTSVRLRLFFHPSFHSFHPLIHFILFSLCFDHKISARLQTVWQHRSILQPTKIIIWFHILKCARKMYTELFFPSPVFKLSVSFFYVFFFWSAVSFRFHPFEWITDFDFHTFFFFALWIVYCKNFRSLMSNISLFILPFINIFMLAHSINWWFFLAVIVPTIDR